MNPNHIGRIARAARRREGLRQDEIAALAGVGIYNAVVEIDGPEVPIMDGSSKPFVAGLLKAGVALQRAPQAAIRVLREVVVEKDGKRAALAPSNRFEMTFKIDFADEAIGRQQRDMTLVNGAFIEELSGARTFGRHEELVDALARLEEGAE